MGGYRGMSGYWNEYGIFFFLLNMPFKMCVCILYIVQAYNKSVCILNISLLGTCDERHETTQQ